MIRNKVTTMWHPGRLPRRVPKTTRRERTKSASQPARERERRNGNTTFATPVINLEQSRKGAHRYERVFWRTDRARRTVLYPRSTISKMMVTIVTSGVYVALDIDKWRGRHSLCLGWASRRTLQRCFNAARHSVLYIYSFVFHLLPPEAAVRRMPHFLLLTPFNSIHRLPPYIYSPFPLFLSRPHTYNSSKFRIAFSGAFFQTPTHLKHFSYTHDEKYGQISMPVLPPPVLPFVAHKNRPAFIDENFFYFSSFITRFSPRPFVVNVKIIPDFYAKACLRFVLWFFPFFFLPRYLLISSVSHVATLLHLCFMAYLLTRTYPYYELYVPHFIPLIGISIYV